MAESRQDANAVSTILALRGQLEVDQGEFDAALASAARAVEVATPIEHFDTVAYASLVAGRAHQKAGRAAEARTAFEESVAAFARVPPGPATETFFDNRQAPYLAMVDLLASQGSLADAFQWSERGRQRALAELLGADGSAVVKGLTAEERDLERVTTRDLRTVAVKIRRERGRQKPDQERLTALQAEQAARQADRDALRRRLYDAHPALRVLRAQADPAGPDAASVLGGSGSALLSFVVGEARTWVFAIAKDPSAGQWRVERAAPIDVKSADLGQQVRKFRESIARKEDGAIDLGRELYALLVGPVESVLTKKTRLVVVPDAFLWSLPFEALPTQAGRFLVEDAAIGYAPSLTALTAMEAARPIAAAPASLVALAQPVLPKAAEERLSLVRPPAAATPTLPADREVQLVAAVFGPVQGKTYVGDAARADRLAAGVTPGAAIHLAVPVVLSEAAPLYSLLAFSPSDASDPTSGLVEAAWLMSWNVPAEVVVVSRVEYGPASGEGEALTGLAWSFFVGGTPTVVVNRWVGGPNDPSGAVRLHRVRAAAPKSGSGPPRAAESLQLVMKGILSQEATRHPFYWAGFIAIGR
jgi:CHAT domain-containing protein